MVSRRNFFAITIMMIVLFCMFQAPQILKEKINDYETNEMVSDSNLTSKDVWTVEADADLQKEYNLFIGSAESEIGSVVTQWSRYRKQNIVIDTALRKFDKGNEDIPATILLDAEYLNLNKDLAKIREYAEQGTTIIFCNLPSYNQIKEYKELQKLLGIKVTKQSKVEVEGYHLYDGFLLGGETIYQAETKEEKEKQDMSLELPWYYLDEGTEVYMSGIIEGSNIQGTTLKREFWPAAIWSHAQGKGKIFAVNGDYVTESMGVGILSAMSYCAKEYDIYPVVDAQILTVANYPGLADENEAYMQDTYNSSVTQFGKNAIYPQLLATAEQSKFKMSFMLLPQYDYEDKNEPKKEDLAFYLKMFKEKDYEAGLSLDYKEEIDLNDKFEQDEDYFTSVNNHYDYATAYTVKEKLEEILKEESAFADVRTMICYDSKMQTLLDYCTDEVTLLSITDDASEHTYTDDLRLKSLETALGYSNVLLDMKRVIWPEAGDKSWEKFAIDFSSNLATYWKPFQKFADTTVSEADVKVRNFLNLNYTHGRKDNEIYVYTENFNETCSFIFRTHGEKIVNVAGASYEELEEDAYLIRAERGHIVIEVDSASLLNK